MSCFMVALYQIPILLRFLLFYVIVAVIMVWIAFGRSNIKNLVIRVLLLYATTYLVGGALNSFFYHTRIGLGIFQILKSEYETNPVLKLLVLGFLLILPVLQLIYFSIRKQFEYQQEIFDVKLIRNEQTICIKALLDTGNELYDAFYQKPVVLLELNLLKGFLSNEEFEIVLKAVQLYELEKEKANLYQFAIDFPGIHTVNFTSVGKEQGKLIAFLIDQLIIFHKDQRVIQMKDIVVGIYNKKFSHSNEYQMILHKKLIL